MLSLSAWISRNIALHASPTARNCAYGVVPKGLLTFLGFLSNAEFSPWKRRSEFIELRKALKIFFFFKLRVFL